MMQPILKQLRYFAYLYPDPDQLDKMAQVAASVKLWQPFLHLAESHGLCPLLNQHLKTISFDLPEQDNRTLKILVMRHQKASQVRFKGLQEINTAFVAKGIDFIALKGVALSLSLYPHATLRPMQDMDLLINAAHAREAMDAMQGLSYDMPEQFSSAYSRQNHHHLPEANKMIDGMNCSVELHTDMFVRDYIKSSGWHDVIDQAQTVYWDDLAVKILPPYAMLEQVSRHLIGVQQVMKLCNVVDTIGFAQKNIPDKIDPQRLKKDYFFVYNALRCLHYYVPLPSSLHAVLEIDRLKNKQFSEVGVTMQPVSQVFDKNKPLLKKLKDLLMPPKWWMYMFYAVAPERNSGVMFLLKHPYSLVKWFLRRIAGLKERTDYDD